MDNFPSVVCQHRARVVVVSPAVVLKFVEFILGKNRNGPKTRSWSWSGSRSTGSWCWSSSGQFIASIQVGGVFWLAAKFLGVN